MNTALKITLGVLSVVPFLYMIAFFVFFIYMFFNIGNPSFMSMDPANENYTGFIILFLSHIGTMLLSIGLLIYYLIFLFKSDTVDQNKKILWLIVLFFFGIFAFPVFWYIYIWQPPTNVGIHAEV